MRRLAESSKPEAILTAADKGVTGSAVMAIKRIGFLQQNKSISIVPARPRYARTHFGLPIPPSRVQGPRYVSTPSCDHRLHCETHSPHACPLILISPISRKYSTSVSSEASSSAERSVSLHMIDWVPPSATFEGEEERRTWHNNPDPVTSIERLKTFFAGSFVPNPTSPALSFSQIPLPSPLSACAKISASSGQVFGLYNPLKSVCWIAEVVRIPAPRVGE